MSNYKSVQGDTWDLIALKTCGDEHFMSDIIEANPQHRETIFFSEGVDIKIPDVKKYRLQDSMPPWKRK